MKKIVITLAVAALLLAACAGSKSGGGSGVEVKARGSVETAHGVVIRR